MGFSFLPKGDSPQEEQSRTPAVLCKVRCKCSGFLHVPNVLLNEVLLTVIKVYKIIKYLITIYYIRQCQQFGINNNVDPTYKTLLQQLLDNIHAKLNLILLDLVMR